MTIAQVMNREMLSLTPEDSLLEAVRLMELSRAGSLPVVDGSGALVGLLINKGLIVRLGTGRRSWWRSLLGSADSASNYLKRIGSVREAMCPVPAPVSPELSVETAADLLSQDGIEELLVVSDGRLVGRVSRITLL